MIMFFFFGCVSKRAKVGKGAVVWILEQVIFLLELYIHGRTQLLIKCFCSAKKPNKNLKTQIWSPKKPRLFDLVGQDKSKFYKKHTREQLLCSSIFRFRLKWVRFVLHLFENTFFIVFVICYFPLFFLSERTRTFGWCSCSRRRKHVLTSSVSSASVSPGCCSF